MTNLMQKMGVHVAIENPNRMAEPEFKLGIEPELLILIPQELMLNPKSGDYGSDPNKLKILKAKIEHLELFCYNSRVQMYFNDWSIIEYCKPEIIDVFSAQIKDLSKTNPHLAMTRDDYEDTAIIEIGKLACFPNLGKCRSPRPGMKELNAVLDLLNESPKLTAAKTQLPGSPEEHLELATTTSGVSHKVTIHDNPLRQNSLISVPHYDNDPVGFESYKSRVKHETTSSVCRPSHTYWLRVLETSSCSHTTSIEEVGT
ncbi:putative powdery mildew-specific protein [Erysiphe neolycopersici]|uniref:Putative powdery mildew-specific protein n=1 Tax=Erysiphe neolycopersici TaxID=212602 RepID=A0A420HK11_9PEZI|nr:putative powdery mildew-specific protein [Erysiphe neolycopersici]